LLPRPRRHLVRAPRYPHRRSRAPMLIVPFGREWGLPRRIHARLGSESANRRACLIWRFPSTATRRGQDGGPHRVGRNPRTESCDEVPPPYRSFLHSFTGSLSRVLSFLAEHTPGAPFLASGDRWSAPRRRHQGKSRRCPWRRDSGGSWCGRATASWNSSGSSASRRRLGPRSSRRPRRAGPSLARLPKPLGNYLTFLPHKLPSVPTLTLGSRF
jgi:hypothetical protein